MGGITEANLKREAETLAHFRAVDRFHAALLKKTEGWSTAEKAQLFRREDEE